MNPSVGALKRVLKGFPIGMAEFFAFDATKNHYGYNDTDYERSLFVLDFDYANWIDVLEPYMHLEH